MLSQPAGPTIIISTSCYIASGFLILPRVNLLRSDPKEQPGLINRKGTCYIFPTALCNSLELVTPSACKQFNMKYITLTLAMLFISMNNTNACPSCDTHAKTKHKHVTVTGNDQMQFDTRQFIVDKGSEVKLTFKNVGKLPKIAMGHNLVILKQGVSALAFGSKCLSNGANASNPLPDSVKSDVLASTKLLGPGESETITFKAPSKPGEYQYVCTFPGHFAMMRGVMTVR